MKRGLALLTLLTVCAVQASAVELGDRRAKVIEHLGEPQGLVKMEGTEWLLYPRGKVWLQEGVVTKAELLSPEEFAAKLVQDERARIAEHIRQEAQRLERIEKGTALRARLQENPDLYMKNARERLSVWERFRQDYPEVDVSEHYLAAREAARLEKEREDRDRKIRDLEARVREAELRALDAQQAAAERNSSRRTRYSYSYPIVYGPSYSVCPQYGKPSRGHGHGIHSYPGYRNTHLYDRPAGLHSSGVSAGGGVAFHSGHITMKPVTFGHVKFSF